MTFDKDVSTLQTTPMTRIERSRSQYLPLLWPVWQLGADVEHNDVMVTLGLLSKQHVPHNHISHVSLTVNVILVRNTIVCYVMFSMYFQCPLGM